MDLYEHYTELQSLTQHLNHLRIKEPYNSTMMVEFKIVPKDDVDDYIFLKQAEWLKELISEDEHFRKYKVEYSTRRRQLNIDICHPNISEYRKRQMERLR